MTRDQALEARNDLRYYAAELALHGFSVSWVSEGCLYRAEPRPDKYDDAWLVSSNHSKWYEPKQWVLDAVHAAEAIVL